MSKYITKIPTYANNALQILEDNNFSAWIVGGFVRDLIIKLNNSDIDIATNAKWQDVKRIFEIENWNVIKTGIKHGTVTVIKDNNKIEITTYRTEGKYSDSRHPDKVEFVDNIEDDLARRDFTINAIAYNPSKGFNDPYNGIDDIQLQTIRTVGDPNLRFKEDALRILRAARFMSNLSFSIETNTFNSMLKYKNNLNTISKERIREELSKLLCGNNVDITLRKCSEIITTCIPEIKLLIGFDQKTKYHNLDIYEHTIKTIKYTNNDKLLRWAALLHDIGKPEKFFTDENGQGHFFDHPIAGKKITEKILTRLKFSKKEINIICQLVRWHDHPTQATKKSVRKMLKKLDCKYIDVITLFRMLNEIKRADTIAHAPNYQDYLKVLDNMEPVIESIINENLPYNICQLNINGKDLINLGYKQGPQINKLLNDILNKVINKEIDNKHEVLITLAKNMED